MQAKTFLGATTPFRLAFLSIKTTMRERAIRILLHLAAGLALGLFLLPEGTSVVLASAVVAASLKALYDYLQEKVDIANPAVLLGGAVIAIVAGSVF